ncbi:ArsR family transcriptional regulator [Oceanispirochaeta crateris]|uniref:ArsR family transcriptional regulator n=1 Tax=Oceanispirochaeta crateris TaxID=2518645 RepID=A0A5C1QRA9_9SPIO|nr:metalloregulator ArsR/SmtB family transcription factor [Oceanispirochaeta crateris]QEN08612.1 ArsR family transcriptional regulator [Oceanispirochaeta crateris]
MNQNEINPWDSYTIVFKALSDITRLKIMWLLLSIDSKISASEIIDVLNENQYNVSKHLRILKNAGLIYEKKEGRWSFYHYRSSHDAFDESIRNTVLTIPEELMQTEIGHCQKRLSMRVDGACVIGAESDEWIEYKKNN